MQNSGKSTYLTECWIYNQTRPVEFQFPKGSHESQVLQASSFTCGNKKTGLSKTISVSLRSKC